jgi:hypothetical protein
MRLCPTQRSVEHTNTGDTLCPLPSNTATVPMECHLIDWLHATSENHCLLRTDRVLHLATFKRIRNTFDRVH